MAEPVITVAILGADATVGGILEQLVAGAGYTSTLLPHPLAEGFAATLAGAGLLLLAPAISTESRDALLAGVSESGVDAPVVELPWPCGTEELKRVIRDALDA